MTPLIIATGVSGIITFCLREMDPAVIENRRKKRLKKNIVMMP